MAEVIELIGAKVAREWLDAARHAQTLEEQADLLEVHRKLMSKTRVMAADAGPFTTRAGPLPDRARRSRTARSRGIANEGRAGRDQETAAGAQECRQVEGGRDA